MNILLTGATGLLGNHLTRLLLDRGHNVRALVEPEKPVWGIDNLPVEKYYGDLRNPLSVKGSAKGMDIIIHAAADTSVWPSRSNKVNEINITGTQLIVKEALEHNIKRFIYVGSASAFGSGTISDPGTETSCFNRFNSNIDYFESKLNAQKIIIEATRNSNLPAVIVNPTFMIGPYDFNMNAARLIISIIKNKIPGWPPGGRNFVHARDVAVGIMNAISLGKIGECYILGNENLTYLEFFEKVGQVTGCKIPKGKLPKIFVVTVGLFQSAIAFLNKKPPQLGYNMARNACVYSFYSSEKAFNHLGLTKTPISTAISQTFNWLRSEKIV